jgi:hypothetical protein
MTTAESDDGCPPKKPAGNVGYAIVVVAAITVLIAWIAVRTVLLAVRGQLFLLPDLGDQS